jgi:diguanylate cyclase (GGDEF)-like protein
MDSKTGLLNAGTWEREAASEVARAVRTRSPLALVLIDVDHFKMVNDLHGHLAGDKALRAIAHVFRIFLRDYDLAGRFGGEEFAVLLPQTSAADARHIAERVRLHIAETPIKISDDPAAVPVRITVSMGVAALGQTWERTTGSQLTDLLAGADRALYQAKNAGRNHVVMVTDTETVGADTPAAGTGTQTGPTVADPGRLSRLSGRLARRAVPSRSVTRQAPEIPADRSWSG